MCSEKRTSNLFVRSVSPVGRIVAAAAGRVAPPGGNISFAGCAISLIRRVVAPQACEIPVIDSRCARPVWPNGLTLHLATVLKSVERR